VYCEEIRKTAPSAPMIREVSKINSMPASSEAGKHETKLI
jgi:hypothetical protein